jgi:hypothetical protein
MCLNILLKKQILFLLIFLSIVKCESYVGESGDDNSGCGDSSSNSCKTLNYAISTRNLYTIKVIDSTTCDNTILINSNLSLSSITTSQTTITFNTGFSVKCGSGKNMSLENLILSFTPTPSNTNLFSFTNSDITIKNCIIKPTSNEVLLKGSMFAINTPNNRVLLFENSSFTNINTTNSIIYIDKTGSSTFKITFVDCNFSYCKSDSSGGCICCGNNRIILKLDKCQFYFCSAKTQGGVLAQTEQIISGGSAVVTGCIFNNCTTTDANSKGGAISVTAGYKDVFVVMGQTNFTNCAAAPNDGGVGGAIHVLVTSSSTSNSPAFKFNETINFINCNAFKGKNLFFEYNASTNAYVCLPNQFDYSLSNGECTIYMKRVISGSVTTSSETMVTTSCLGVEGVCLSFLYLFHIIIVSLLLWPCCFLRRCVVILTRRKEHVLSQTAYG